MRSGRLLSWLTLLGCFICIPITASQAEPDRSGAGKQTEATRVATAGDDVASFESRRAPRESAAYARYPAGGYPFSDGMEYGSAGWAAGPAWEVVEQDVNRCWRARPSFPAVGPQGHALSPSAPIALTEAHHPVLTFKHRYNLESGVSTGLVEVSEDGGSSWRTVAAFEGLSGPIARQRHRSPRSPADRAEAVYEELAWTHEQIDLDAHAGVASFLFRFRLVSSRDTSGGTWFVDDVSLSERPTRVSLYPVEERTRDSLALSWTPNVDPVDTFHAYRIYRDSSPGVLSSSRLVAEIRDQVATRYVDSTLVAGATFYYRIFVVSVFDVIAGSQEQEAETLLDDQCFLDDMESGAGGWTADCAWQQTDEEYHSADTSWTDSPGALYLPSQDCSLRHTVVLDACDRPYLSFWHRYSFETDADWGYVEVSNDGGSSWTRLFGITGPTIEFERERVDLSEYAGQTIEIRFRLITNASNNQDGWHIDDVGIFSNTAQTTFPFSDAMEGAETGANWIPASWALVETEWNSPTHSWTDSPAVWMYPRTYNHLTLVGSLDFSNVTQVINPQIKFWQRTSSLWSGAVQLSTDSGLTWANLYSAPSSTDWQRRQVDLSPYLGAGEILLRFQAYGRAAGYGGWWIDDVLVSDAPLPVTLQLESPSDHAIELCWTMNEASDFAQYELYRSENANEVGSLVGTFTDPNQTCHTDSGLKKVLYNYYYRMYVRDSEDLLSQSSNQVTATTTCSALESGVPFFDDIESGGGNWCADMSWGITEEAAQSSTHSWSDSPGNVYANNESSAVYTKLVVSGVTRPTLSFWHRYSFETDADWGYVEVSNDGGASWARLYGVTGPTTSFEHVRIDLSDFIESQLLIRFLVSTNGANGQDGWHIDDVRVEANTTQAPYPFCDDMEGSQTPTNWIPSAWTLVEDDWNSEVHSWTDSKAVWMYPRTYNRLTLAGSLDFSDLANIENPELRFAYKTVSLWSGAVQISTDSGQGWTNLFSVPSNSGWQIVQVDLSTYLGAGTVLLRFEAYGRSAGYGGWWIDDVEIAEVGEGCEPPTCPGKGDVTCDDTPCSLFDVLESIDQALAQDPHTCEADVDCSDAVDLFDILCLIDCALDKPDHCLIDPCTGGSLPSGCTSKLAATKLPSPTGAFPTVVNLRGSRRLGSREGTAKITLNVADGPIRGLSVAAHVPSPWSVTRVEAEGLAQPIEPHFYQNGSTLRVILVSPDGAVITAGRRLELKLTVDPGPIPRGAELPRLRLLEAEAAGEDGRPLEIELRDKGRRVGRTRS